MSQQLTELPPVARNVHLPCKKCATDRYFVVVAHTSPTSAKVKCEVCGASKTFKLPKAQVRRKVSAPSVKKQDAVSLWVELKEKIGTEKLQKYSMKAKYQLANAIEHPKFGIGFVTIVTDEKIEVAFQEGGRALVHNRPV